MGSSFADALLPFTTTHHQIDPTSIGLLTQAMASQADPLTLPSAVHVAAVISEIPPSGFAGTAAVCPAAGCPFDSVQPTFCHYNHHHHYDSLRDTRWLIITIIISRVRPHYC